MSLPDFVILGAQKSASTYLAAALSSHPQVYMPPYEVRFFEDPEYRRDLSDLKALFRGNEHLMLGIKRPDYLACSEVPARLQRDLPGVRLIALLREPVSRLVSAYYYYIKLGFLPPVGINRALPGILRRYPDLPPRERELLDYGCYGTQLSRYQDYFATEQMLVLLQDDMTDGGKAAVDAVCDFLHLPRLQTEPRAERSNSGVYSIRRLKWLRLRNRFFYRADAQSGRLDVNLTPVNYLFGGLITAVDRYFFARFDDNLPPQLDAPVAGSLRDFYRNEVDVVERMMGRKLPAWREK